MTYITTISFSAVLMGANNTFDFGTVNGGQRKYINISMANIGAQPVKLKMSLLSPFGPFAFCNVLREIPSDSYYSLRFKFEPTEGSYLEKSVRGTLSKHFLTHIYPIITCDFDVLV